MMQEGNCLYESNNAHLLRFTKKMYSVYVSLDHDRMQDDAAKTSDSTCCVSSEGPIRSKSQDENVGGGVIVVPPIGIVRGNPCSKPHRSNCSGWDATTSTRCSEAALLLLLGCPESAEVLLLFNIPSDDDSFFLCSLFFLDVAVVSAEMQPGAILLRLLLSSSSSSSSSSVDNCQGLLVVVVFFIRQLVGIGRFAQ